MWAVPHGEVLATFSGVAMDLPDLTGPSETRYRTHIVGARGGGCKKILSDSASASPGFTHSPILAM